MTSDYRTMVVISQFSLIIDDNAGIAASGDSENPGKHEPIRTPAGGILCARRGCVVFTLVRIPGITGGGDPYFIHI